MKRGVSKRVSGKKNSMCRGTLLRGLQVIWSSQKSPNVRLREGQSLVSYIKAVRVLLGRSLHRGISVDFLEQIMFGFSPEGCVEVGEMRAPRDPSVTHSSNSLSMCCVCAGHLLIMRCLLADRLSARGFGWEPFRI